MKFAGLRLGILFALKGFPPQDSTFFFFFFLTLPYSLQDLISPIRDWTCAPLQWKCILLTSGPPGKSLKILSFSAFDLFFFFKFGSLIHLEFIEREQCRSLTFFPHITSLLSYRYSGDSWSFWNAVTFKFAICTWVFSDFFLVIFNLSVSFSICWPSIVIVKSDYKPCTHWLHSG